LSADEIKYFEIELSELVGRLRSYFASRRDVVVAVLFGSALRGSLVRDVDVAVYTASRDLDTLLEIGGELEELLRMPVDLVPLDQMRPHVRLEALSKGLQIVVRDRALFTELLKTAISEVEDLEAVFKHAAPSTKEAHSGSPLLS